MCGCFCESPQVSHAFCSHASFTCDHAVYADILMQISFLPTDLPNRGANQEKTYNCSMFELCVRAHPIYPIQVAGTSIPHMKTLMAGSCLLIFGIDNQYIDRPLLVEMTLLIQNANISQVWSFRSALPLACQVQDIGDASEQAGESSQVRSGCSEPQLWLPWLVV